MKDDKKKYNKAVDLVAELLYQQDLEREKKEIYPKESIWPLLKKEIQNHGYECEIQNMAEYICSNNPEEFRDIIMKYYKICTIDKEKAFLVSCLINKKNAELTPFILSEFEKLHDHEKCMFNTMVANFIHKPCNKKYKDLYIKVLKNKKLKKNIISIFPFIETLKIKEVEEILVDYLNDDEIISGEENHMKKHILKSLSKYKDSDLLYLFKKYLNDDDRDVRKICERAIENINKIG